MGATRRREMSHTYCARLTDVSVVHGSHRRGWYELLHLLPDERCNERATGNGNRNTPNAQGLSRTSCCHQPDKRARGRTALYGGGGWLGNQKSAQSTTGSGYA